jgi:hypothetical protein
MYFIICPKNLVINNFKQLNLEQGAGDYKYPQVKYGVRSPKFIWAPCAQLYHRVPTPSPFLYVYASQVEII